MMSFSEYFEEQSVRMKQRSGRSRSMIRASKKIQMKRKIASRKKATPDKLLLRAQKRARTLMRKEISPDYMSLTDAQKIVIDRKLETKKAQIETIARKLLPKVKEDEEKRLLKFKETAARTA